MKRVESLDELRVPGFWYVATPFSKYPYGHDKAFLDAVDLTFFLKREGIRYYCPIAASYIVARYAGVDSTDLDFWNDINLPWMLAASGILVAEMEGWECSIGIRHELGMFEKWGRPRLLLPLDLVVRPLPRASDWMVESSSVDMRTVA